MLGGRARPTGNEVTVTQVPEALDGAALLSWARSCRAGLESRRSEIDALNVFPIADSDTGTNLLATMRAALAAAEADGGAQERSRVQPELGQTRHATDSVAVAPLGGAVSGGAAEAMSADSSPSVPASTGAQSADAVPGDRGVQASVPGERSEIAGGGALGDGRAGEVAKALARGATAGARGNSGIILSQVLRGIAEAVVSGPLTGERLRVALRRAAVLVRQGLSAPVEGTILTVLDRAAVAAAESGDSSLESVAKAAADGAARALNETPAQLGVLRAAGVVDAGARGLLVLLDCLVAEVCGVAPERHTYARERSGGATPATGAQRRHRQSISSFERGRGEGQLPSSVGAHAGGADARRDRGASLGGRGFGEHAGTCGDHDEAPGRWNGEVPGRRDGEAAGRRDGEAAGRRDDEAAGRRDDEVPGRQDGEVPGRQDGEARGVEGGPGGDLDESFSGRDGVRGERDGLRGDEDRGRGADPHFEVMYVISGTDDTGAGMLRERLAVLGDSVVVVGDGDSTWSAHVHCRDAGAAIEAGLAVGALSAIRVESFAVTAHNGVGDHAESAPVDASSVGRTTLSTDGLADRGVVAVVAGADAAELFQDAGAVVLREDEAFDADILLRTIRSMPHREVLVLPNGALPAQELVAVGVAARDGSRDVLLLPSASMVQGLAALAVHDRGRIAVDDAFAMSEAAATTRWGALRAARVRALTMVGTCSPGDGLGLVGDDVVVIDPDVVGAGRILLDRMLGLGGELVTLLMGAGAGHELGQILADHVRAGFPGVDVVVYSGGQQADLVQIGVE
ncbi:DAK2 domain-containing protein [Nocardia sp. NPDC023988]|uniref:DAK2 domain-containing protein n=1 Tax=Nocardia sp. NPDC023988 TaxID=3155361 RepID=UPI0033C844BF